MTKAEDYTEGDLLMLTIDTAVEHPAQLIVFKEIKTTTIPATNNDGDSEVLKINTLTYYPLTDLGLEVAKSDNGTNPATFHRATKYTATNVHDRNLLLMDTDNLRGYSKTLYDNIINEL